jgi:hypothetical protein
MANPLTATLSSPRVPQNRARPGDTVFFKFSNPPSSVTEVGVLIRQAPFGDGQNSIAGTVLATFEGNIANGKYVPLKATGSRLPPRTHMPLTISDGTNDLRVGLVDNGNADLRNELQILVRGNVGRESFLFVGKAALFVDYPLVMIAPTQTARRELTLNVVASWAAQWGKKEPRLRRLERIAPSSKAPGPPLDGSEYDPLVNAFTAAVSAAPGGIIALATGHGDGGQGNSDGTPWCNLMPEDIPPIKKPDGTETFFHRLNIQETELVRGLGGKIGNVILTPGGRDIVKLTALDRIADELKKATTPIRKVLLHTCNAGNSKNFVQLLADRLQIPVQAHLDFINFTGVAGSGRVVAHYETDKADKGDELKNPEGLTEWPLSKASKESVPGAVPPRFS